MNLAKRMAYLKKRDGLTTEMLSQRSGVATGTLNKLLNGATRRPALETMERVARAFGVPVRYFTAVELAPEHLSCVMEDLCYAVRTLPRPFTYAELSGLHAPD